MRAVYDWVRNLAGYLIFLSVLEQLLPEKQYTGYVRLFAGMVFLLLAVSPLTDGDRLTERIAGVYRELELRNDTQMLRDEISGVEMEQRERLFSGYEQAVAADVRRMAGEWGIPVSGVTVEVCREEGSGRFGSVTGIQVLAGYVQDTDAAGEAGEETAPAGSAEDGSSVGTPVTDVQKARLRAALRADYHLEDAEIEIRAVEREG